MQLKDLKIGTQLRLGLGFILALVVVLGAVGWIQTDLLWLHAKNLYEHPHQVRRALGKLEVDIQSISLHTRDLFLAKSSQETMKALQNIELCRADAEQQFNILYGRYLGPRDDIVTLHQDFARWNVSRDETIRLLQARRTAEAEAAIRPGGIQDAQGQLVRSHLKTIDDFARNKADQLYRAATEENDACDRNMALLVTVILLLTLLVAWWLRQGIKAPLAELTAVTEQFRQGKLEARSRDASANEFGALSAAFNSMADTVQTEMRIDENAAQLAGVMLREEEVHAFCLELLKALLQHTGSQVGAVYLLNETKTAFEHFESIGLGAGGRAAFSATGLEGELGAALATRQIQRITDIPADTRFTFAAVTGDFRPQEILTIPILSNHEVSAVISLASLRPYDAASLRLVKDIGSVLTARLNGVLAFRKTKELAERLEHQNRELDAQKRELAAQAGELTGQNTELEMQKRQLDEVSRLKSAFLSNMSHELRTPLNSVIALAGVLNRRLANSIPAEEHGYLEVIERNGKHLLSLINDILDLSRIEAGREELSISRFSVAELAGEIAAMLEPQAREKQIVLLNQVPGDLPPLASDPDKCRHILQNLIANAVKFTEHGQITITAEIRLPQSEVLITVADTGIGIPAGQLPFIFDEFRQGDETTSRKYGGSGLGLAIAKKYAVLLGGGITVESAPGQGSTFTVRLPLALELTEAAHTAESVLPLATPGSTSGPTPSGQGHSLLVVEDNEPAIIQLTDILQAQGYHLQVARDGQEALARIEQTLPDGIILDLMMPQVDGFQVLKAIRGVERTAHLPVLILTAKHVTRDELSFLKGNHIHQLIQKGDINKANLLAAVARMVAPPAAAPAPTPPPPRQRPARPGKPVVLVVEDNPDSLRAARALLQESWQVIEAQDGRAGVEQARAHQPDLILMDIALPVHDGVRAFQEIRQDEKLRHIPIIALTEQKNLEAQFLRAQRLEALGTLASGIAHDLNNILAPIRMVAPLLRDAQTPAELAENVDLIETSTQRASDVVRQLLAFGRGGSGERMALELKHMLRELRRVILETFPKNISFIVSEAPDLWPLVADPTQLHQVLLNLCINARDAMPEGGTLKLTAINFSADEHFAGMVAGARPGAYALLQVSDTGTGIPPEHLGKIFDPFFTTKAEGRGTGLGLAVVYTVATNHGGFVQVRSQVGKGTTFEVYLPASPAALVHEEPASPCSLLDGHGELILVVDDEESIRQITEKTLQRHGYRVLTARDGTEAVVLFAPRQNEIKAVVTDLMMPGMDGLELVKVLAELAPALPVVVSTGGAGVQALDEKLPALRQFGVRNVLTKPYATEQLLKALHAVIFPIQ